MNGKRIYISGAIAHHDIAERMRAFLRAAEYIKGQGGTPVNPFDNGVPVNADWREHMRADIHVLTDCDGILMLRGWEQSKGAKLEFDVATSCGLEVWYQYQSTEARGRYSCKTRTKAASFGGKLDVDQAVCGAVFF